MLYLGDKVSYRSIRIGFKKALWDINVYIHLWGNLSGLPFKNFHIPNREYFGI